MSLRHVVVVVILLIESILCVNAQQWQYVKFYYPDSTVSSEGWMRNGQPDSVWRSYFENGALRTIGYRKGFQLDSVWQFFEKDGSLHLEISYKNGKRNGQTKIIDAEGVKLYHYQEDTIKGESLWYTPQGHLFHSIPYQNGVENGLAKWFDTAGNITATMEYNNGYPSKKESINYTDASGFKQGKWKYFYDNGCLKMEAEYKNNIKNGYFKYYDSSGHFQKIEKWENDILIDNAKETKQLERKVAYHPNGKIKTVAYFFKGILDGVRTEYSLDGKIEKCYLYQNGILTGEGIVDDDGKKQGQWKEFYLTGELRASGRYKNSRPIGDWRYFYEDGKIEISGSYTAGGQKDGQWLWYYPDGQILEEENYIDGMLDGFSYSLSQNGDTLFCGNYSGDLETGKWYYSNDSVLTVGEYFEGMRNGTWKTFYPNGKIMKSADYVNDKLDGKLLLFWENGVKKADYTYSNGLLNGSAYQYDQTGNVLFVSGFKMGVEITFEGVKVTPTIDISYPTE